MAMEAIERVKQAEEKAAELVREAKRFAAEMVEAARRSAADKLEKERTAAAEALGALERSAHEREERMPAEAAAEVRAACIKAENAILNKKGDTLIRIIDEIKAG